MIYEQKTEFCECGRAIETKVPRADQITDDILFFVVCVCGKDVTFEVIAE